MEIKYKLPSVLRFFYKLIPSSCINLQLLRTHVKKHYRSNMVLERKNKASNVSLFSSIIWWYNSDKILIYTKLKSKKGTKVDN
jgi:hypothetical protein